MSKKNKKNNNKNIEQKNTTEEKYAKEPMTNGEKLFIKILIICACLAIVIIIVLSIPYNGDKGKIANKYDSLTVDNVFELIEFDELQEKINNGENCQVLVMNKKLDKANYYIFCVDMIAKEYVEISNEKTKTIYLIDSLYFKDAEIDFFKDIDRKCLTHPTIIEFDKTYDDDKKSTEQNSSSFYDLVDYENNYFELLKAYFKDCYQVEEPNE